MHPPELPEERAYRVMVSLLFIALIAIVVLWVTATYYFKEPRYVRTAQAIEICQQKEVCLFSPVSPMES